MKARLWSGRGEELHRGSLWVCLAGPAVGIGLSFSHSGLLFGQREIFSREEKNKSYFTKYLFSHILLVFFI